VTGVHREEEAADLAKEKKGGPVSRRDLPGLSMDKMDK